MVQKWDNVVGVKIAVWQLYSISEAFTANALPVDPEMVLLRVEKRHPFSDQFLIKKNGSKMDPIFEDMFGILPTEELFSKDIILY